MKILIANTIIFILIILTAIFCYFKIAIAEVEMSASVPENCVTKCIMECGDTTITFGEDYYKEVIEF